MDDAFYVPEGLVEPDADWSDRQVLFPDISRENLLSMYEEVEEGVGRMGENLDDWRDPKKAKKRPREEHFRQVSFLLGLQYDYVADVLAEAVTDVPDPQ